MVYCPNCRKNNVWFQMIRQKNGKYKCDNCGYTE